MAEQGRTFRRCCVLSGCPARVHGPRLAGCAVGCQHCPQQVCDHHVFGGHGAARDSWHDRAPASRRELRYEALPSGSRRP